jgi:hypothetical protein
MLLKNSYEGFVRSGALLEAKDKERLRALTEEASMCSLQFSQNLLKENKAFTLHLTQEEDLDGLPDTAREAAAAAAKEHGVEGWVITLDAPSYGPFMMYSTRRELRRQLYMAHNTLCIKDNSENNLEICKRLVNLRREMAQLLGYENFADYVLQHRMATDTQHVYQLLNNLIDAYKPTAEKELKELKELAQQTEGKGFKMEPWDTAFYAQQLKLKKYNLDPEMLRPYLELNNVIKGVFGLATRLYGITFKENTDIPVYHPDVKPYEVYDKDGTYLAVVSPDHNVLPLIIDHFQDRFNDQSWLIYDARRHYGYYYGSSSSAPCDASLPSANKGMGGVVRITFEDEASLPFDLTNGKLDASALSTDDQLFQNLWRTYFKAICIRERINPKKQLNDMPRRYWRYMTEKN